MTKLSYGVYHIIQFFFRHARVKTDPEAVIHDRFRIGQFPDHPVINILNKSFKTWVFDDVRGISFLDFTPEVYFRVAPDFRIGGGLTIRKATHDDPIDGTDYDQEWLHTKIVRQFGNTQYIGRLDYEFESDDFQVGAQINILF